MRRLVRLVCCWILGHSLVVDVDAEDVFRGTYRIVCFRCGKVDP